MKLVPIDQAKLVVIFDFSCLAYRAFHSKTKNQNAVITERILMHLSALAGIDTAVVMALDSPFLNKATILPHYKAHRPRFDENPKEKFLWILDLLPFYQAQALGEEADDVICSFIQQNPDKNMMVITGDSDLIHLMDRPNVMVVSEQTMQPWNENKHIKANYLKLSQISAFKTLFGDVTDNVKPIWPRLRRKYFEEVIWIHSHDKRVFIEKTMDVLREKYEFSEEQLKIAKTNLLSNYDLVIPRFDLQYDLKAPDMWSLDSSKLIQVDPSLVFLSQFFSGEKTKEPIYDK